MDKTREERNPKRQARGPASRPCMSAARAVAELDDAIWTSIIELMPIPRDLQPSDEEKHEAAVAEVATTWQTLLHLRIVSKKLAALLHPVDNAALWRRLVLQSFDFPAQPDFNVENFVEEYGLDSPSDEEDEGVADEKTEQNPQFEAMHGWYDDAPPNYLEEDIACWETLDIYHRPSQYGFLTMLQEKPPKGEGQSLPPGEGMNAGEEGGYSTDKYLAAPAEADSTSAFHRFYVMKTLGYVPHFWHWGSGIGEKWKGFTEPDAFEKAVAKQVIDSHYGEDASFVDDDDFGFPGCSVRDAKRLYRHIRQHCRDWRSVCCNSGSDGETPVFFVGESKAAPYRWTGYMGDKCWT